MALLMRAKVEVLVDEARFDLVVQYALAVADQDLGAIHLLKYAYLADLAYARSHGGETFTGTPWRFLHFGPYSAEAHGRVPDAAKAIGAEAKERKREQDGKEYTRYAAGNERLAEKLRDKLPTEVATAVRWGVKDHGGDTASLLEEVYRTEPMLNAAPGEALDFKTAAAAPTKRAAAEAAESGEAAPPRAAWKVRREEKETRARILAEVRRRLDSRAKKGSATGPAPRYDAVHRDGIKQLDAIAGDAVPVGEGEATFADSVWKSSSRRGPDASE